MNETTQLNETKVEHTPFDAWRVAWTAAAHQAAAERDRIRERCAELAEALEGLMDELLTDHALPLECSAAVGCLRCDVEDKARAVLAKVREEAAAS